ncbi:carbonic anhydrase [Streptomyces sp. NPDC050418]|uniref:carbonic anhydrase n=1 Tax=Streptomyces sp. NPDC050418 TaxID=3365612 RepID=UPI0037B150B2
MDRLFDGVAHFRRDVFPARRDLFARLATEHRPETLFIGCSDARVPPELITQSEPGELFVIRTAGNLIPAYAPGSDGVAASIEYAVSVLGVREIVVCGHSSCGAMTALAEGHDLSSAPVIADWLRHADGARARARTSETAGTAGGKADGKADGQGPAESPVAALVRANVAAQLQNLGTHPSVIAALAERRLTLHGWVFDIASGSVEDVTPGPRAAVPAA